MIKVNGKAGTMEASGDVSTLATDFCTGIQVVYQKLNEDGQAEIARDFKEMILAALDKTSPVYLFKLNQDEDMLLEALAYFFQKQKKGENE